jgi:transitional endoplasmic reticulum ATPase
MVEEAKVDDNSSVMMSQAKMSELKIFKGEPLIIKGKKRKETLCVVLTDNTLEDGKIRMNKTVRKNLRVRLGDVVMIKPTDKVPNLTRLHVLPIDDSVEGFSGDFTPLLTAYFKDAYRPVTQGDLFLVKGGLKSIEFKVVATEPGNYGLVGPGCVLHTDGEPIKREEEEKLDDVGYDDIGGCRK